MELLYVNKKWSLPTHVVTFKDGSEEGNAYTTDIDYWRKMESLHEDISIINIEKVTWGDDVVFRLGKIQGMPEGWSYIYSDYVFANNTNNIHLLPFNHPMRILDNDLAVQRLEMNQLDIIIDKEMEGV